MIAQTGARFVEIADWAPLAGGIAVACVWLGHLCHHRRDPLADAPPRPNELTPLAILACMAAYLAGIQIVIPIARNLLANVADPKTRDDLAGIVGTNGGQLAGAAACVVCGHMLFTGGLAGFGLRPRRWPRDVVYAVGGWLFQFPLCFVLLKLSESALRWWQHVDTLPLHPVLIALDDPVTPQWVRTCAVVGAVAIAPIAEELFFRGIVQTQVAGFVRSRWIAVLLTGAVFGLMHMGQPQAVVPLAALGVILGYVYERTGSLAAPVLLHALFNGWTTLQRAVGGP